MGSMAMGSMCHRMEVVLDYLQEQACPRRMKTIISVCCLHFLDSIRPDIGDLDTGQ